MRAVRLFLSAAVAIAWGLPVHGAAPKAAPGRPAGPFVEVTTSLPTEGANIAQFAFDGDAKSYFLSARAPKTDDHYTLSFDPPVKLAAVSVAGGKPEGGAWVEGAVLEVSVDGTTFENGAPLAGGGRIDLKGREIKAVRIRFTAAAAGPVAIREIVLEGKGAPAPFKYPVEFTLDVSDALEMKEWGEKVVRLCTKWYPIIAEELRSERYSPPRQVKMVLKSDYKGVAAAGGDKITGSVKYFKDHPDDVGAMIHETTHIIQQYRRGERPGWLVEGIADYIRNYRFETKNRRLNPDKVKYSDSYQVSAAFLNYVAEKHDKDLVRKLNEACRQGTYRADLWKELTGRTLEQLGEDWKAALKAMVG